MFRFNNKLCMLLSITVLLMTECNSIPCFTSMRRRLKSKEISKLHSAVGDIFSDTISSSLGATVVDSKRHGYLQYIEKKLAAFLNSQVEQIFAETPHPPFTDGVIKETKNQKEKNILRRPFPEHLKQHENTLAGTTSPVNDIIQITEEKTRLQGKFPKTIFAETLGNGIPRGKKHHVVRRLALAKVNKNNFAETPSLKNTDMVKTKMNYHHYVARRLAPFPNPQPRGGGGNKNRNRDTSEQHDDHLNLTDESQDKFTVSLPVIIVTSLFLLALFVILTYVIYRYWR